MAYNPTTWIDGTTPVDASHLNALEGGVSDNADAIDSLSGRLTNFRVVTLTADSNAASSCITAIQDAWENLSSGYSYLFNIMRTQLVAVGIGGKYGDTYGGVILFGLSSSFVYYYRLSSGTWQSGSSLI